MRHLRAVSMIVVTALIWVPVSFAQQPSSGAGEGGGVQGAVGDGGSNAADSLPFTGVDLIVLVGGAALLLALGLGLRAVTRTNS